MNQDAARFDRAYFDKWYRHPRHRVATPAEIQRRAALAVAIAEYILGRAIRSVLDVGCGEALWRAPLRRLRPGIRYHGVDPSEYAVRRFGRARNIRRGAIGELTALPLRPPYDLIVCVDVLHYLTAPELERGLRQVHALLGGVAYLPAFTTEDELEGDVRTLVRHTPAWYRQRFRAAGLVPVGLDCYVPRALTPVLSALERG